MSKVLVVDDDPHIRELARVFLKNEGYDTYEASAGMQALSMLETTQVDLVVLDIMMPSMDGWELCRQLRELYDIPVLMLTARGETSQKLKGFELGTDDYLVKPFEPLELVARVKALLKRYCHRPCHFEGSRHPAVGRSHQLPGQRIGGTGAGGPQPADVELHHGDHRPPLEHHQGGAAHRRAGERAHHRAGHT